ncbi:MAG: glycoside hydrolase family 5 protein [Prevotella sp.]|nr:glycoside hydrolase family 5 protein [Prevotella sp.]
MKRKRQLNLLCALLMVFSSQVASAADFETATEAVQNMKVGWNLGNTLESNGSWINGSTENFETAWGQPITQEDLMKMMKNAGFNAIRVPVTWYQHMNGSNQVDAAWMARVHEVVDYVINQGMYCILNVHHDTGADDAAWLVADESAFNQQKARFETLWQQIANEFINYDEHLLFEGYNEMLDVKDSWCFASFNASGKYDATIANSAYNAINSYAQSFVNTVRATGGNNANRNLIVCTYGACCGSGTWNTHLKDPLKMMNLPSDNVQNHLIFEVHYYPNVKNLSSTKNEVSDLLSALNEHLVSKGAPVIFGEWGTANDNERDYDVRRDNVLSFARYFVEQTKANNMTTFYWMGLSDGQARLWPMFNQPDLAESILKGCYGDNYKPQLPTSDDYDYEYTVVTYNSQYGELYLYSGDALNLSEYSGIRVELAETPPTGLLSVKCYGLNDGKESYNSMSSKQATINFNSGSLGQQLRRVTLQCSKGGTNKVNVVRAVLLKKDGSEVETVLAPFWGCRITDIVATFKGETGIAVMANESNRQNSWWTIDGRRLTTAPSRSGIYIHNGRKVIKK